MNSRIAEIHTLKSKAGLSDEDYRVFLGGWGVESSKNLTPKQAAEVVATLRRLAGQPAKRSRSKKPLRFDELAGRGSEWATPAQLRKIHVLWVSVTRQAGDDAADAAFNAFLHRQVKVSTAAMVTRGQIGGLVRTLEAMAAQAETRRKKDLMW